MKNNEDAINADSILVFAPHNDDEILAAGGLIQRYVETDTSVKIAVMTNGDGQIRRPPFLPFLRPNFVKLGYKRQNETLEAMEYLGLSREDVKFFGYPDRGLSRMWTKNWTKDDPYYSKYTKTDRSPYENSYTKRTLYCGSSVVEDVKNIMLEVEPDVVYLPHPNDSHPDHWATNGLVLYGLEKLKSENYEFAEKVNMLSYIVHSVKFPWPRGKFLEASLSEPHNLKNLDTKWVEIPLDLRERLRKLRAIGKYRTQNQLMRKYLISFARANELFGIVPSLSINGSKTYDADLNLSRDFIVNEDEDEPFLFYLSPKRRSRLATLKRYPDIQSVSLTKMSGRLKLKIEFFNRYRPGNEIQVTIKPFRGGTKVDGAGESHAFLFKKSKLYHNELYVENSDGFKYESSRKTYSLSIPLNRINEPNKLILSITLARKGIAFARSANRLVKLR